jgi:uncharacterized protein (UPF0212 family)
MQTDIHNLIREMEACSEALGLSLTTIGRKVGQDGLFYARLKAGKRAWPETVEKARAWIAAEMVNAKQREAESPSGDSLESQTDGGDHRQAQ